MRLSTMINPAADREYYIWVSSTFDRIVLLLTTWATQCKPL